MVPPGAEASQLAASGCVHVLGAGGGSDSAEAHLQRQRVVRTLDFHREIPEDPCAEKQPLGGVAGDREPAGVALSATLLVLRSSPLNAPEGSVLTLARPRSGVWCLALTPGSDAGLSFDGAGAPGADRGRVENGRVKVEPPRGSRPGTRARPRRPETKGEAGLDYGKGSSGASALCLPVATIAATDDSM